MNHSDTIGTPSPKARASLRSLHRLRLIGWLEGISYLVLLGIAMPLRYLAGIPEAVKVVGWAHGLLFILFVAAVADVTLTTRWPWKRAFGAFIASLVPFGTFVLDTRLRRDMEAVAIPALAPK